MSEDSEDKTTMREILRLLLDSKRKVTFDPTEARAAMHAAVDLVADQHEGTEPAQMPAWVTRIAGQLLIMEGRKRYEVFGTGEDALAKELRDELTPATELADAAVKDGEQDG